jgi:hypothetical protein
MNDQGIVDRRNSHTDPGRRSAKSPTDHGANFLVIHINSQKQAT